MRRAVPLSAIAYASIGFFVQPAVADVPGFCNAGETNCVRAHLANVSSATVKSTNITQEAGNNDCDSGIKKTISQNLTGGTKATPGEKVTFYVDKRCKYKVKFKTTSGCTGDKTTHISSKNFKNGKNVARLEGGCGTLKTKTTHPESSFE